VYTYYIRSRVSGVYTTPPLESIQAGEHRHIRRICASPFTFFVASPPASVYPPCSCSLLTTTWRPFLVPYSSYAILNVISTVQNPTKIKPRKKRR